MLWPRAAAALGLFSLAGCVVGPKYQQPVPPIPGHFKEGGAPNSGTPQALFRFPVRDLKMNSGDAKGSATAGAPLRRQWTVALRVEQR